MERNAYETRLGLINFWAHMPKYLRIKKVPVLDRGMTLSFGRGGNVMLLKKQSFSSERWFINLYAEVNFKCSFQTKFPASLLNKKRSRETTAVVENGPWPMQSFQKATSTDYVSVQCSFFWPSQKLLLLLNWLYILQSVPFPNTTHGCLALFKTLDFAERNRWFGGVSALVPMGISLSRFPPITMDYLKVRA